MTVLLLSLVLLRSPAKPAADARQFDLQAFFDERYAECLEQFDQPVAINSVVYHDFGSDGREEIIVTASTCHMGTAGPDIHAVYEYLSSTAIREMPIEEADSFGGEPLFGSLVGNRNYFLYPNSRDELVAEYHDESERPPRQSPLILYYRWNGEEFRLVRVERHVEGRCPWDCPGRRH